MAAGQVPFLLLFLSFLLTFVTTRTITRMIRAGVGPFRNNFSSMGLVLLGVNPLTSNSGLGAGHVAVAASAVVNVAAILICVRKGKYSTAVLGVFLPPVAWIGAVRLARPGSAWARRRYDASRSARARARADGIDARFGHWGLTIADLVAGRPSSPDPVSPTPNP